MKHNLIEIKPLFKPYRNKNKWEVTYSKLDGDRVDEKTFPNDAGFYYHSEEMSKQEAFEKLKTHMINRHKEEIKRLEDSINSLSKLEIN